MANNLASSPADEYTPRADDAQALDNLFNTIDKETGNNPAEPEVTPAAPTPEAPAASPTELVGKSETPAAPTLTPSGETSGIPGKNDIKVETPGGEAKPPAAPAAPAVAPVAKPAAEKDEEIDAIKAPVGVSPKTAEHFENLRSIAKVHKLASKRLETEKKEIQVQLQEAQTRLQSVPDQAQFEELKKFRRMFDIKNDPQFTAQFDKALTDGDNDIFQLMESRGLPPEDSAKIKEKGIGSFSSKWWDEEVLNKLRESEDPADNRAAVLIESKLKDRARLEWDKEKAVKEASDSGSTYVKDQLAKKEFAEKHEQTVVFNRIKQLQAEVPWLQEMPILPTATPEQKAQAAAHNKFLGETQSRFFQALNPPDPETKVETAVAACLAFKLADENEVMRQQMNAIMAENEKLKNVGKTASAGRAAVAAPSAASKAVSLIKMSGEDAFDLTFDNKEIGKK